MKKRLIITLVKVIGLFGGAFIFGTTVDMQFIHYVGMVFLMAGGFALAMETNYLRSSKRKPIEIKIDTKPR